MSQENVDIVRSLFAAFAERNLGAAAGSLDPEIEIRPAVVGGPEGTIYRGLSGNEQFWADIDSAWAEFRPEPEEFRDLGDRVLVLGRVLARASGSGIELDQPGAWLAVVSRGKIVRFQSFTATRDALEAAGLSE